jgi:hypothetical protein
MELALIVAVIMASLVAGYVAYVTMIGNPRVVTGLKEHLMGERAERAMLLTFSDGNTIPVNHLREDKRVYAGADGVWWRAFNGEGAAVTLLIQGEALKGHTTVELEDQEFIDDLFPRLRPAVPEWRPDWANGNLVIVDLKVSTD